MSSYMKCLEHRMHSPSMAVIIIIIIICFHKWDNWSSKVRRLSYIPTVHSTVKFIVKALPSPTFPFTQHLGYTLQSPCPLDASGSRDFTSSLWFGSNHTAGVDRLSLGTYAPTHTTISLAGTTCSWELSLFLPWHTVYFSKRIQTRNPIQTAREHITQWFLSVTTHVYIHSKHISSSQPQNRALFLVRKYGCLMDSFY